MSSDQMQRVEKLFVMLVSISRGKVRGGVDNVLMVHPDDVSGDDKWWMRVGMMMIRRCFMLVSAASFNVTCFLSSCS